jgi:hypothetical protein
MNGKREFICYYGTCKASIEPFDCDRGLRIERSAQAEVARLGRDPLHAVVM